MEEVWKNIKDYEGIYQVSNLGNVRSLDRVSKNRHHLKGKILKQHRDKDGYLKLCLFKNGVGRHFFVHRLVTIAFIPNPDNKPQVNHIDEDKDNNKANNLEWCTVLYNNNYGKRLEKAVKSNDYKKLAKINEKPIYGFNPNFSQDKISFNSIKEAAQKLNTTGGSIGRVLRGERKTNHGWVFTYQ